jgi:hypothetical protein
VKEKKKKKKTSNMPFGEQIIDPHELHDFDEERDEEKDRRI